MTPTHHPRTPNEKEPHITMDYVFINWNTLTWTYLKDLQPVATGSFNEPTFASAKKSAQPDRVYIGASLAHLPGSIEVCKAGTLTYAKNPNN